jgi:NTE family protein
LARTQRDDKREANGGGGSPVNGGKAARTSLLWLWATLASGCATTHYTVNAPLMVPDPASGHRLIRMDDQSASESMFIHLSFSGGGLRAAALAFGVMEELAATRVRWQGRDTTLWHEVDVISAVSGGGLLAASVAAFGDEVFERFPRQVLAGKLQSDLLSDTFSVAGLWRLTSPRFGRSDLLERRLDASVFGGMRFSDVIAARRRPFVILSASEMRTGERFDFTQDRFDQLCSDLGSVPLARAVAASAAAPIVLSPVTFLNYGSNCAEENSTPKSYVHVVDGGLADNLATRALLEVNERHGVTEVARRAGYRRLARVVFIMVNAETTASSAEDDNGNVPNIVRSALALADIPINHVSASRSTRLRQAVVAWQATARAARAHDATPVFTSDVEFHLIEISLRELDEVWLQNVTTSLQLDEPTADALRAAGRRALRASGDFRAVVDALQVHRPRLEESTQGSVPGDPARDEHAARCFARSASGRWYAPPPSVQSPMNARR